MLREREEDEQFRRVFYGDCDITEECVDTLNRIKNNHPNTATLYINSNEEIITELGWRLLGGYNFHFAIPYNRGTDKQTVCG